jgi:hypothetical protein
MVIYQRITENGILVRTTGRRSCPKRTCNVGRNKTTDLVEFNESRGISNFRLMALGEADDRSYYFINILFLGLGLYDAVYSVICANIAG